MRIYSAPKLFTVNYVQDFLTTVEETFFWKQKLQQDVVVDLRRIEKIDVLGLLILYKYIDFTTTYNCFEKPTLNTGTYIKEIWNKYEFMELIQAYVRNKVVTENAYKDFKVKVEDKFIIAPQALLRNTNYTSEYLKKEFIPKIESYYNFDPKCTDLIFTCFCEILLNFWEHAIDDTKSVIIADGNRNKIEIACADTGIGIVENIFSFFNGKFSKGQALSKALEKGVTSKPNSNHMGFGLWMVDQLVTANNGRLFLYSQGYFYQNNFGKIKEGKFPYWPGSIIYINLSLSNPQTFSDLFENMDFSDLKINFT